MTGLGPDDDARWIARRRPSGSLLGSFYRASWQRMLALGTWAWYEPRKVLVQRSELDTSVFLLLTGVVKATAVSYGGRDVRLASRMSGDLVGEFAKVGELAQSATVTKCGPVEARVVGQVIYLDFLHPRPRAATTVSWYIVGKLPVADMLRTDFVSCEVATRLARVLLSLAASYGEPDGNQMIPCLTQPECASMIGAAEPSVRCALRRFREVGTLRTSCRRIAILDLDRMGEIAGQQREGSG